MDSSLTELRNSVRDDLLVPLWQLNGFPEEMMPEPKTEAVQFKDIEQITVALREMSTAGAILDPSDPVIGEVRDLLGLSRPPEVDEDLALLDEDEPTEPRQQQTEEGDLPNRQPGMEDET